MPFRPHMTMKSILDKEESRKSGRRSKTRRDRPCKSKKTMDVIKDIK